MFITQRAGIAFRDPRYTAYREYYGDREPGYVLRFCGDFIGAYRTAEEARAAQHSHNTARMKEPPQ